MLWPCGCWTVTCPTSLRAEPEYHHPKFLPELTWMRGQQAPLVRVREPFRLDPRRLFGSSEAPRSPTDQSKAEQTNRVAPARFCGRRGTRSPDIFLVREAVVNESTEPPVRHFVADEEAFDFVAGNWFSAFQGWIVLRRVQSGLPA
jgi:hypothetical protein